MRAPYARNARRHSPKQIQQIAAAIRAFGFTNPLLIDDAGMILAGHGRVIINVPPRSLKSYMTVVSFVAFMLGRQPSSNVVCVSYSQELANKHARDCRALMESPFYRELFPGARLNPKRTTESDFMTTSRGGRLATGRATTSLTTRKRA